MAENKKGGNKQNDSINQERVAENEQFKEDGSNHVVKETPEDDLQVKFDELQNRFHRLFAEFDNYKRRTAKEMLEHEEFAAKDLMTSLLPVLDDFDRAIKSNEESKDVGGLNEGFKLIHHKVKSILEQKGLEPMDSMGKKFDTDNHEAITQIPAPKKKLKGKVVDVIEKGYVLKGKVLRHAKVVIGK
jgi:molecular chaperone GrpE